MPLFECACPKCGTQREFYRPTFTEKNPRCEECGSKTERIVSPVAFHDWHRTTGTTIHRPYTTKNIRPDGKPVTITSQSQLEKECKAAGVTPAWTKESRLG